MTLIISTCREKISELEFVEPLRRLTLGTVKHHSKITRKDIEGADRIIISGTALADFEYLEGNWDWLKTFDGPILGICAGMQVIAKSFGAKLLKKEMIGPQKVETMKENPLFEGEFNAYFLHTYTAGRHCDILAKSGGKPCAIKHPEKPIYAVSFHPEVMNELIIKNFLKLKYLSQPI